VIIGHTSEHDAAVVRQGVNRVEYYNETLIFDILSRLNALGRRNGYTFVDRRLYLPEVWFSE